MNRATHRTLPPTRAARAAAAPDLLREAEAQCALAELFPHLKLEALRAIQELFPLQAQQQQPHGSGAPALATC
jgi:hypothetical protein